MVAPWQNTKEKVESPSRAISVPLLLTRVGARNGQPYSLQSGKNSTQLETKNLFHPRQLRGNSNCVTPTLWLETWRIAVLRKSFPGVGKALFPYEFYITRTSGKPFHPPATFGSNGAAIHSSRNHIRQGAVVSPPCVILFSCFLVFP